MLHSIIRALMNHNTANTDAKPNASVLKNIQGLTKIFEKVDATCKIQRYDCISKESGKKITHANLFVTPKNTTGPYLLFQGHIDTVPFVGPYEYKLTKTYVKGRGSVDMKGPLAGSIDAFMRLCKTRTWTVPPALLITGDEEANSFAGIKKFINSPHPDILFCINGEPTNLAVGATLCGVAGYRIIRSGSAGHSAFSENNRLLEEALPLFKGVKNFLIAARKIKEKNFGNTRGALTIVRAGEKDNQLPNELIVSWNIRTVKPYAAYKKIFDTHVASHLHSTDTKKFFYFDPCVAAISSNILFALRVAMKSVNYSYIQSPVAFFTEATLLNAAHIPTIVCGPGDQHLAHVVPNDEKILLKDIQKYSDFLVAFVTQYRRHSK